MNNIFDYLGPLLYGVWITIKIFLGGSIIACLMAFLIGLGRLSSNNIFRTISLIYTEFLRGTSALIQLFWVYFALPMLGIEVEAIVAGIVVLGLNAGAYGAEIVRGAIQSIPKSQYQSAAALNMTQRQTMWRIIIPQAMIRMIPPFGNLFIELLKNTALVSLITVSELTFQGQILRAATLKTAEIFSLILVMYFVLALCITWVMKAIEKRLTFGMDYGGIQ